MDLVLDGVRQALALLFGGDGEVWAILLLSLQVSASATRGRRVHICRTGALPIGHSVPRW